MKLKTDNPATSEQIKPLCADDLDAVIAIDAANSGVSRRGYFEKRLAAATDRPRDYVYSGLHNDGKLAGFAFAKLVEGEFGKPGASASLDAIGVDPACRGKGAGHRLLGAVCEVLKHKGVEELTSQVGWANRALLGFLGDEGFALDSRLVLIRSTDEMPVAYAGTATLQGPREIDHSSPHGDDFAALSRDRVPVRSMNGDDLKSIISIDARNSGRDRTAYYERKQHEVMHASGVRVSLVAELEGYPVGFIMARMDFGEFGLAGREAVMDTIGVDPGYRGHGVGHALMSQLMANLSVLRVETVRTEVEWNAVDIIGFLDSAGFVPAQRVTVCRKL
ncbi:MAG: GNAT family N-acetyltransferase [Paracoccaceae bacterium]